MNRTELTYKMLLKLGAIPCAATLEVASQIAKKQEGLGKLSRFAEMRIQENLALLAENEDRLRRMIEAEQGETKPKAFSEGEVIEAVRSRLNGKPVSTRQLADDIGTSTQAVHYALRKVSAVRHRHGWLAPVVRVALLCALCVSVASAQPAMPAAAPATTNEGPSVPPLYPQSITWKPVTNAARYGFISSNVWANQTLFVTNRTNITINVPAGTNLFAWFSQSTNGTSGGTNRILTNLVEAIRARASYEYSLTPTGPWLEDSNSVRYLTNPMGNYIIYLKRLKEPTERVLIGAP